MNSSLRHPCFMSNTGGWQSNKKHLIMWHKVENLRVLVMREDICVKAYQDDEVVVNRDFFLC